MKILFSLILSTFAHLTLGQSSDLSNMRLAVLVRKDTTTSMAGMAHNHGIEAGTWEANFQYNSTEKTCSCNVIVPVDSLVVDSPEARRFVGLSDDLDEDTRKSVRKNMLGSDQLNAKEFRFMQFNSTSCTQNGNTLFLSGVLSLRGESNPITIEVKNFSYGEAPKGEARFSVFGSDFGMEPYSAMLGAVKNLDELIFIFKWE